MLRRRRVAVDAARRAAPGEPTRLERARVRSSRGCVPRSPTSRAGLAGLTDRVLPYLFPTLDRGRVRGDARAERPAGVAAATAGAQRSRRRSPLSPRSRATASSRGREAPDVRLVTDGETCVVRSDETVADAPARRRLARRAGRDGDDAGRGGQALAGCRLPPRGRTRGRRRRADLRRGRPRRGRVPARADRRGSTVEQLAALGRRPRLRRRTRSRRARTAVRARPRRAARDGRRADVGRTRSRRTSPALRSHSRSSARPSLRVALAHGTLRGDTQCLIDCSIGEESELTRRDARRSCSSLRRSAIALASAAASLDVRRARRRSRRGDWPVVRPHAPTTTATRR